MAARSLASGSVQRDLGKQARAQLPSRVSGRNRMYLPHLLSDPSPAPTWYRAPLGYRKPAVMGIRDPENKQARVWQDTLLGVAQSGTLDRVGPVWSHHLPTPGLSPSAHQVRLLDELKPRTGPQVCQHHLRWVANADTYGRARSPQRPPQPGAASQVGGTSTRDLQAPPRPAAGAPLDTELRGEEGHRPHWRLHRGSSVPRPQTPGFVSSRAAHARFFLPFVRELCVHQGLHRPLGATAAPQAPLLQISEEGLDVFPGSGSL